MRFLFVLSFLVLMGCAKPVTMTKTGAVTVKDSGGRMVSFPTTPKRIVSLAPAATEILYSLGAGEHIVGVTTVDTYPDEVKSVAKVGGFTPATISVEAIVSLKPDVVITAGSFQQATADALERLSIITFATEPTTFDETTATINQLGLLCGQEQEAAWIVAQFQTRFDAVKARSAARQGAKPKVLFTVAVEPLMAAGPKTFLGEAIEVAGGENLLKDVTQQYPRINLELLTANPPDIILGLSGSHEGELKTLTTRPGWDKLPAVQRSRVVAIPDDLIARAGPRLIQGLELVEKAIWGDVTPK